MFFITVEPAFSKQATEGAPVALTPSHHSHHYHATVASDLEGIDV